MMLNYTSKLAILFLRRHIASAMQTVRMRELNRREPVEVGSATVWVVSDPVRAVLYRSCHSSCGMVSSTVRNNDTVSLWR